MKKKNLLKNDAVQSLLASLGCIVFGLLVGYVVLLFIQPKGAGKAILTIIENFFTYNRAETQMKYLGSTLVKTAPLLMCSLSILFAYKVGLFNIGGPGQVTVDGTVYPMGYKDCLYITRGSREVLFSSDSPTAPAKFYMVSAPAHCSYETRIIRLSDAARKPLGALETSNKRVIHQFIHPDVLPTCQLSMGMTVLEPGSVWNTMPAHTHERRMEVYTYFEIPAGNVVFHMMGEGQETRHIVLQNEQAVISPSWSIHAGAGTGSYSFIWAMGGENQAFDDMDVIPVTALR